MPGDPPRETAGLALRSRITSNRSLYGLAGVPVHQLHTAQKGLARPSLPCVIAPAYSALGPVKPGVISMQPIGRYGLENGGPELEMGRPVDFAFDRWQAGRATQGLWREHRGNLAQPEADSGNLPVPPSLRHLVVFEADQCHAERTAVAVAVEVDAGVTVAEHGPVPEPVRAAVNNVEAEVFEEAERILYLTVPPICFRDSKPRHSLMLCSPA